MNATAKTPPPAAPPAKAPLVNAQTEAFSRWMGKMLRIQLQSGREVIGILRVFDQYALVVQIGSTSGPLQMVYKHAIETVGLFIES